MYCANAKSPPRVQLGAHLKEEQVELEHVRAETEVVSDLALHGLRAVLGPHVGPHLPQQHLQPHWVHGEREQVGGVALDELAHGGGREAQVGGAADEGREPPVQRQRERRGVARGGEGAARSGARDVGEAEVGRRDIAHGGHRPLAVRQPRDEARPGGVEHLLKCGDSERHEGADRGTQVGEGGGPPRLVVHSKHELVRLVPNWGKEDRDLEMIAVAYST